MKVVVDTKTVKYHWQPTKDAGINYLFKQEIEACPPLDEVLKEYRERLKLYVTQSLREIKDAEISVQKAEVRLFSIIDTTPFGEGETDEFTTTT